METSSGPSLDSSHPYLSNDHIGPEITSIFEDPDSERVFGNSLEDDNSSSRSLDTLISNSAERINQTKVLIPLLSCCNKRYVPIRKG